jgi:hypothetical protein
MSHPVHLVGSVPLADPDAVFRALSRTIGSLAPRLPDGETGVRARWMGWLEPLFADNPDFVHDGGTVTSRSTGAVTRRYRPRPGVAPEVVRFAGLRHAEIAIESYRAFADLKRQGVVAPACRYQFALAHPYAVVHRYVEAEFQAAILPVYERALLDQLRRIFAAVPHGQLAIQWDIASAIFTSLQLGDRTIFGSSKAELHPAFAAISTRIGEAIPAAVDLLYHFCYGSSGNRHTVEPLDMGDMVEQANRISAAIQRPVQLFHMPVPVERDDEAYFGPLAALRLKPGAAPCLGLVHDQDGMDGTQRRMEAARKFVKDFFIATECGFGRRNPESLEALLRLHAEIGANAA